MENEKLKLYDQYLDSIATSLNQKTQELQDLINDFRKFHVQIKDGQSISNVQVVILTKFSELLKVTKLIIKMGGFLAQ